MVSMSVVRPENRGESCLPERHGKIKFYAIAPRNLINRFFEFQEVGIVLAVKPIHYVFQLRDVAVIYIIILPILF